MGKVTVDKLIRKENEFVSKSEAIHLAKLYSKTTGRDVRVRLKRDLTSRLTGIHILDVFEIIDESTKPSMFKKHVVTVIYTDGKPTGFYVNRHTKELGRLSKVM